jgi:uncharacterized protein
MLVASWVEIPVKNLERAIGFYQTVFKLPEPQIIADEVRRISILATPTPEGKPGVSLNQTPNFEPSDKGTLAYFYIEDELSQTLQAAETAGGKIVEPGTPRGNNGYFALVLDTEGNLLTIHSAKH